MGKERFEIKEPVKDQKKIFSFGGYKQEKKKK